MLEEELLTRARDGDTAAFNALLERHSGAVWNYLLRFMPGTADCEDLFQDVFVKAWLKLDSYNCGRGAFRAWLLRIAATASLDELKRRRRERARVETWAEDADTIRAPHHGSRSDPSIEAVRNAVGSLPDTERQTVVLSFYHDLSMPRIAALLGIPLGTVKSRMRSALARLREQAPIYKVGDE